MNNVGGNGLQLPKAQQLVSRTQHSLIPSSGVSVSLPSEVWSLGSVYRREVGAGLEKWLRGQ